jgi:hypothetical protein
MRLDARAEGFEQSRRVCRNIARYDAVSLSHSLGKAKCLLRVKRVVLTVHRSLPVFPDKQTFHRPSG